MQSQQYVKKKSLNYSLCVLSRLIIDCYKHNIWWSTCFYSSALYGCFYG